MTEVRPFAFAVRPCHFETVESYSSRVLAANFEDLNYRSRLLGELGLPRASVEAWVNVLTRKTARDLHLLGPITTVSHPDGATCDRCTDVLPPRRMCLLCARGADVTQRPHFSSPVCAKHRRWIGLGTSDSAQHTVASEQREADKTFRKLARARRLDAPFYVALVAMLLRDRPTESEYLVFPLAMQVATIVTAPSLLRQILDPGANYAASFATLVERLESIQTNTRSLARGIWLLLWTTAAAVNIRAQGGSLVRGSVHDFPVSGALLEEVAQRTLAASAFRDYLLASGDDIQAAHAFHATSHQLPTAHQPAPAWTVCDADHRYLVTAEADWCPVCALRPSDRGRCLEEVAPHLVGELDYELNRGLTAAHIASSSSKKVWWRCPKDHRYPATPNNRTLNRQSCPVCLNRSIQTGANDLLTLRPAIAAQWHPANPGLPSTRGLSESAPLLWICADGHIEEMSIMKRVARGCTPCDAARKVAERSIDQTHPSICREWHPTKNDWHRPEQFTAGSHHTAFWRCSNGHTFPQRIDRRALGAGCKYCAGRALLRGFNDFATTDPDLAVEWHPTKNVLEASDTMSPNRPFWWRCRVGAHDHHQTITHRRVSGGCPLCPIGQRARPRT